MRTAQASETRPCSSDIWSGLHPYDPMWLTLHTRLHRQRQRWSGQCAGQTISVGVAAGDTRQPVASQLEVQLALGTNSLVLQLPAQLLDHLGLADITPEEWAGTCGSMLLECALLSIIEPLEKRLEQTVQVLAIRVETAATSTPSDYALSLILDVRLAPGAPSWAVPLHLDPQVASLLADLLDHHTVPAHHSLADLRMPLSVIQGEVPLSVAELRSLRPGDMLVLADGQQTPLLLRLDTHLQGRVRINGNTLTLLETPCALNPLKEHCMTDSNLEPSLDALIDELPLKVQCQVGSVELSLAQLRALGPGSVMPLAPQVHVGVSLMVNGRCIGQGQLVKIGDGLGVRLLSFATP
nr:type III secretion system cytoplasmic ring protein SctQ [uncultured Pseudomonas sp.]